MLRNLFWCFHMTGFRPSAIYIEDPSGDVCKMPRILRPIQKDKRSMIKLFLQKMEFTVAEENGCKIPMLVQIMEQRDEKLVIFPVRKEIHTGLLIPFIRNVGDIAPQNVVLISEITVERIPAHFCQLDKINDADLFQQLRLQENEQRVNDTLNHLLVCRMSIFHKNLRWYICTIIIGSDGRIVNY